MRIEFTFSGGYGGLFAKQPLAYRIDTDELPEETRTQLLELIRSSGLLDSKTSPENERIGDARDIFTYALTIQDKSSTWHFKFDDSSTPANVHPLLSFLRALAIQNRTSGP